MGFLDMGPLEIVLILLVALLIWGPNKIPEIARTLGKTTRALKKATSDLTSTVTKELDIEEKGHMPQTKTDSNDKSNNPSVKDDDKPKIPSNRPENIK
ncbi:twin-arginine translocase TatA/TatE family subunit [Chloroflexota bacterium]